MIRPFGHIGRVHPTASFPLRRFAGTKSGSAPTFRVARRSETIIKHNQSRRVGTSRSSMVSPSGTMFGF
jgi:hypothetical protein